MGHRFILPPTRFDKADRVLDYEGNEGIITEVFVSYPSRGNFADWTKPEIHYQVTFFNGPKRLHLEGELTDWIQTQLQFTNDNPLSTSDTEEWSFRNM